MQTNILWTGREYYSLENCLVTKNAGRIGVNSVIVGKYQTDLYRIEYSLYTDERWRTIMTELNVRLRDTQQALRYESDGNGNWSQSGKDMPEFAGCLDIDISLTPFTNTLPVNRLALGINETSEIKVVYFDLLNQNIRPAHQRYTRLAANTYKFENVPNDFEAVVTVDERGFVVDYPELFEQTYQCESHYF